MAEQTDIAWRGLRRLAMDTQCPARNNRSHDMTVQIEDGKIIEGKDGTISTDPMDWPHEDPRWPKACTCGYEFSKSDYWHLWYDRYYRVPDGRLLKIRDLPVGALWYADWMSWKGPDGHSLALQCPSGEWLIDGPAAGSGTPWQRSGTPPNITVHPSIRFLPDRFHGIVEGGVLRSCPDWTGKL